MLVPRETKSPVPAGEQGHRAGSKSSLTSNEDSDTSLIALQAAKLSRIYCFGYTTACTVGSLAFAGGSR